MTVATERLSAHERAELREFEADIAEGARGFVKMGRALAAVRDRRLYRETHDTFDAYCKDQWGMGRGRAYELIGAAEVVESLSAIGVQAPTTERAARELTSLRGTPEVMAGVMTKAVEQHGSDPTAAQLREIVRPSPPGDDIRFTRIENAADSLRTLPSSIAWPTEPGDITAMDSAFAFLTTWLPAAKTSWTQHKKDLNAAKAEDKKASRASLKAVA